MIDHEALKWLVTVFDASEKLLRWLLAFSEFEFFIAQHARIKHKAVD